MLKDTAREAEIDAVEQLKPQLLQLLPAKKKTAFARIRTLHGLLKVALDDFETVLARPDVVIDMGVWVSPMRKDRCAVCLAGSVIYQQYGIRSGTTEEDMGLVYGDAVERRLVALNDLRIGDVTQAWSALHNSWAYVWALAGYIPEEAIHMRGVWVHRLGRFTYARDERMTTGQARAFLGEMRALQKDLKTAGL